MKKISFGLGIGLVLALALSVGADVLKPLTVPQGGTNANTLTNNLILFGQGTARIGTSTSLFWDNANLRLGVGTGTPGAAFSVQGQSLLTNLLVGNLKATDTAIEFPGYNCTGTNGGVLTVGSNGVLICDDDDGGAGGGITMSGAPGSLVFANTTGNVHGSSSPAVGYIVATTSTASILPVIQNTYASSTSISLANLLSVNGTGTSTFTGGLTVAGLDSSRGLRVSTGDSIFAGGVRVAGEANVGTLVGASLATCNGGQFLQWAAGSFACNTPAGSGNLSGNLGINMPLYAVTATTLSATSSPTATTWTATSTTAASTFPIASTTSFSVANLLTVAGAGTSTFTGKVQIGGDFGITPGNLFYDSAGQKLFVENLRIRGLNSPCPFILTDINKDFDCGTLANDSVTFTDSAGTALAGDANFTFTQSANRLSVPFASSTAISLSNLLNVNGIGTSTFAGSLTAGAFAVGTSAPSSLYGTVLSGRFLAGGQGTSTIDGGGTANGGLRIKGNLLVDGLEILGGCKGCPAGGGAGTPGGNNTEVQFNDSSAFGGDAQLTYNKTTDLLTISNSTTTSATILDKITAVGGVGVGTTTFAGTMLDVFAPAGRTAFSVGSSTNSMLQVLADKVTIGNGNGNIFLDMNRGTNIGFGTTTPWGLSAIEIQTINSVGMGNTIPAFVVGDEGTSTPAFIILNANGYLGIGTSTPGTPIAFNGVGVWSGLPAEAQTDNALCIHGNDAITTNAAATCTISSRRFKNSISYLDSSSALSTINALLPARFISNGQDRFEYGLIAEDVELVDPSLVFYEDDGVTPRGIKYETGITALNTAAIQELHQIILEQQTMIESLENRIRALEQK